MTTGGVTVYTPNLAAELLKRLSEGESLRGICEDAHMPDRGTVLRWIGENEELRNQYARAREAQADAIFDDMLRIADDGSNDWMMQNRGDDVAWVENGENARRSALRIDARKWILARMAPKKYGDKLTVAGDAAAPISVITWKAPVVR